MTRFLTTGEIARRLGVAVHRVEYVISTRRIQAAGRAGIAKVYSDAQLRYIEKELKQIEEERNHASAAAAGGVAVAG